MLALERRSEIWKLIQEKQTVLVGELSSRFQVTDETIRRDLERLEATGVIVRTHGGAVLNQEHIMRIEQSAGVRKQTNIREKTVIAELVAAMIADGDTIMLDDSSTSLFILRALQNRQRLTLLTNSLEILNEATEHKNWNILGSGGVLREQSMSFVGNQAEEMLSGYYVDRAIISCRGIDRERGITEASESTALVKKCMLRSARTGILAVDHSKFGLVSFVRIGQLDRGYTIITDIEPPREWLDFFVQRGINCVWSGGQI